MKKAGRPTKYKPIYCKKIVEFFDIPPTMTKMEKFYYKNGDVKEKEVEVANELPTILRFARSIGTTDTTVVAWTKKYKPFLTAYLLAKSLQEDIWLTNGLKGLYNPYFAGLMGKNIYGWKDKQEVDTKHTGELVVKRVSYKELLKKK